MKVGCEDCKIKELKMVQKYRVVGSSKLKISDWLQYYLFNKLYKNIKIKIPDFYSHMLKKK